MKICLLGVFSNDLNEGYKNIAFNLSKQLSKNHDVCNLDVKDVFSIDFWKQIKDFNPNVIHYLTAPTLSSFIILKLAKIFIKRDVKLVISSLHPYSLKLLNNSVLKRFVSLLKPDIILTQSIEVETILKEIGCRTNFLSNGVDTYRFHPVSIKIKEELRQQYGIDKEKFVILHVGHIRDIRGLKIFNRIQKKNENIQVVIVSSSYFEIDKNLYRDLLNSGCIVWNKYFENIEEIFALSDCYIFPASKGGSIFMPLSVLEAMSSNLPVFATKYEGLIENFEEGNGLVFFENEEDLLKKWTEFNRGFFRPDTRDKIMAYSWEHIGKRLGDIYDNLLSGE
ncbi:Glycosyl transferases group 1 [uncultured archaeon]|nr:Glycosyl transferases group 1 [uncultured archaeon]